MPIIIRKIKAQDIDALIKLGTKVKEFRVSRLGNFWSKKQLLAWSKSNNDLMLVALKNQAIVGYALFSVHLPTKKATFENLWVNPNYRGQNIASLLVKHSQKKLKEININYLVAIVSADNKAIKNFLKLHRFSIGKKVIWVDKKL